MARAQLDYKINASKFWVRKIQFRRPRFGVAKSAAIFCQGNPRSVSAYIFMRFDLRHFYAVHAPTLADRIADERSDRFGRAFRDERVRSLAALSSRFLIARAEGRAFHGGDHTGDFIGENLSVFQVNSGSFCQQSSLDCSRDGCGAGIDSQFVVDAIQVRLDRALRNSKMKRDLFTACAA